MAEVDSIKLAAACIFAKPPVAGTVKTRLIPVVGAEQAADLAEAFLQDTLAVIRKLGFAEGIIASTEPFAREYLRGHLMWIQPPGDLGVRMEAILRRALLAYPMAFAIGADSPGLPVICMDQARNRLESHDVVLGPSMDGGFYLIGVKHCPPRLLSGIEWSRPTTMQQTISRLRQQGLSVAMLPDWFDVDTAAELSRLESLLAARMIDCPYTQAVLEGLRRCKSTAGLGK
jgi:hypothetical protein